jgi:hypothetical protein
VVGSPDRRRQHFFGERYKEKRKNNGGGRRRVDRTGIGRQGPTLIGALPCPKDASEGGTLHANVARPSLPAGSLDALGALGWMAPFTRVQIWKKFIQWSNCENVFKKDQN